MTDRMVQPAPAPQLDRGSFYRFPRCFVAPIGLLFALALAGCDKKAQSQEAAPAPPLVTVAQPVKRTVTDWDEFTGRFEAIQDFRSVPASVVSSTASSSQTVRSFMPAICSTSLIRARS